ncbi:MAG: hypothetical protein NUV91_04585 [Candidatus Omnitrophica bacterium]|nr:hypothetical protein [Candidatus Omnitrophota bacterium]
MFKTGKISIFSFVFFYSLFSVFLAQAEVAAPGVLNGPITTRTQRVSGTYPDPGCPVDVVVLYNREGLGMNNLAAAGNNIKGGRFNLVIGEGAGGGGNLPFIPGGLKAGDEMFFMYLYRCHGMNDWVFSAGSNLIVVHPEIRVVPDPREQRQLPGGRRGGNPIPVPR